jgi:hypothetical protein
VPQAHESPGGRVVRARCPLWHVEGAKGEAEAAGSQLGVEGAVGSLADAAEARRSAAVRRHLGEARGRWSGV